MDQRLHERGHPDFPYAGAFNKEACNAGQAELASLIAPVATFPGCEGGFPGVFDCSGNVSEWIDACDGNAKDTDQCKTMGGHLHDATAGALGCKTAGDLHPAPSPYELRGFRCCAP